MDRPQLDSEQRRRLRELYDAALDLPVGERREFAAGACDGDTALRTELESLLDQTPDQDDGFLATPLLSPDSELARELLEPEPLPTSLPDPTAIGPYRILDRLGSGGMGVVYRGEQTEPLRRAVAVKVIKPGMDTERVVARFTNERQALARMDHPGIARIHDAGTTPEGRPWFAMQLVDGQPIDVFCHQEQLRLAERLELFCRVCDAVQHAHQKGVIHRDLKPSNVLARRTDGQPEAVIIDFGIARALATSADAARGRDTLQHEVLGTLDYMAPEQATSLDGPEDVDSRADVYSLGVLLYQLLTGELPFHDSRSPDGLGMRERTATPPSGRTDTRTRAGRDLRRSLREGLDWISVKALEPDRERRYQTASELAAEVRRFLAAEPILAGPPTLGYRLRTLVRRHRAGVAAAGLALAGILGGAAAAVVGLLDAREQSHRAEDAADLLLDWLVAVNLETGRQETRETLDRAASHIGTLLSDRPRAEASARKALGQAYFDVAAGEEATEQLGHALALLRSLPDTSLLEQYEVLYLYRWAAAGPNRFQLENALDYQTRAAAVYLFVHDHPEISRKLLQFLRRSKFLDAGRTFADLRACAEQDLKQQDPRWIAIADMAVDESYRAPDEARPGEWLDFADQIYGSRLGLAESNMRRLGTEWARLTQTGKAAEARDKVARQKPVPAAPLPASDPRVRFLTDCHAVLARFQLRWPAHHWYTLSVREEVARALRQLGRLEAAAEEHLEIARIHRVRGFDGAPRRTRNLRSYLEVHRELAGHPAAASIRDEFLLQTAMSPAGAPGFMRFAFQDTHPDLCNTLERLYEGSGWPAHNHLLWQASQDRLGLDALEPLLEKALVQWKRFEVGSIEAAAVAAGMATFAQNWGNLRDTRQRPPALLLPWLDHSVACLQAVDAPLLDDILFWRALTYKRLGQFDRARADALQGLAVCQRHDRKAFRGQYSRLIGESMLGADPPDVRGGLDTLHQAHAALQHDAGLTNINTQTVFNVLVEELARAGEREEAKRVMHERLQSMLRLGAAPVQFWVTARTTCTQPWAGAELHELALRAAETGSRMDPDHEQGKVAMAHAALRTGDRERALEMARLALEEKPDSQDLRAIEALCLHDRHQEAAARLALAEAERIAQQDGSAFQMLREAREALR